MWPQFRSKVFRPVYHFLTVSNDSTAIDAEGRRCQIRNRKWVLERHPGQVVLFIASISFLTKRIGKQKIIDQLQK